jgi:hypothetical protein
LVSQFIASDLLSTRSLFATFIFGGLVVQIDIMKSQLGFLKNPISDIVGDRRPDHLATTLAI